MSNKRETSTSGLNDWTCLVNKMREDIGDISQKSIESLTPFPVKEPAHLMMFCIMEMMKQIVCMLAKDQPAEHQENAAREYAMWDMQFEAAMHAATSVPTIQKQFEIIQRLTAELEQAMIQEKDLRKMRTTLLNQLNYKRATA